MLVSLTVLLMVMAGLTSLLIENSRINKAQQLTAQAQADARNSLAVIEQRLRSAGWDPLNAGISTVNLDGDLSDAVSEIEVFADLDGDGTVEPMFVPDSATNPRRISIRITARSPVPNPMSGEFIRFTVASDVVLRKSL